MLSARSSVACPAVRISKPAPDQLTNDQLAAQIKENVSLLQKRGARRLAFDTCFGEAEDIALTYQHEPDLARQFAARTAEFAHSVPGLEVADVVA